MSDLVRGELPEAGQREGQHRVVLGREPGRIRLAVGCEQALRDQVVLADAERAQRHVALQDLARPRVDHRCAVAPAARRPVDPLDHVDAHVQRVEGVGQDLDAVGVSPTGRLEGLGPPAGAVQQRAANGLRRPGIEVIDDGLDRVAHPARVGRSRAGQAVARDHALHHVLADGHSVVGVGEREVARGGREGARHVAVVGELDERVSHADGHSLRVGGYVTDVAAGLAARERQPGLQLGVLREALQHRRDRRAAAFVERERPLAGLPEPVGDAVRVADDEVGGVDQYAPAAGRDHVEAPDDRRREGVGDGRPLGRVVGVGAEAQVGLHEQHPPPDPFEPDDSLTS